MSAPEKPCPCSLFFLFLGRWIAASFFATGTAFALGSLSVRCFRRRLLLQVLNNQRNPPVRWILRGIRFTQSLIGESPHLRHLIFPYAVLLHHPPRRVGAVGGKLPVSVGCSGGVLFRIRVTLHCDVIGQFAQFLRKQ